MNKDEKILKYAGLKKKNHLARTVSLNQAVTHLMEATIAKTHTKTKSIAQAWQMIVPAELRDYCEITSISAGRITIAADSPSHMYELRLHTKELLEQLSRLCPAARIKQIKIVPRKKRNMR